MSREQFFRGWGLEIRGWSRKIILTPNPQALIPKVVGVVLACCLLLVAVSVTVASPANTSTAIVKKLEQPVSVDFQEITLQAAFEYLTDATQVNIVLSNGVQALADKVDLFLNEMPLKSAIKYLTRTYGLVYRVEPSVVWISTPAEMEVELMETRVYFLDQGKGMFTKFEGATVSNYEGLGGARAVSEVRTIRDVLEEAIPQLQGSKLVLDERTGALIATNTPANLRILEEVLYNIDISPVQVLIEARFMETNIADIRQLGVEGELTGPLGIGNLDRGSRYQIDSGSGVDFGSSGVDFEDITTRGTEGFNVSYQGVLSQPQFNAVLHALEENQVGKTLSVPKITTLNNQTATIEVVDEFIYPTRYEVSLVQFDINGDGDFDDAGETEFVNAPRDFVTRDVGILLHVTPSVGNTGKTITLTLVPEVSEFKGTFFTYTGGVSIPQFTTRHLKTSVLIQDGETVVMGGLMKETRTSTDTKVPIIGDIPIIGRLFRNEADSVTRQNLLIFVTASLMNDLDQSKEYLSSRLTLPPDALSR